MRLYEGRTLMTNPRRVTIYLAEKGIAVEKVELDMRGGEGRSEAYLAKNPAGTVPLLELDDGSYIPESAAIVEYFEELYPEPNMLGDTPEQRARTRAMERTALDFGPRNSAVLINTHPFMTIARPGFKQNPEVAKASVGPRDRMLEVLEAKIGDSEFVAGDKVTIADCTLYAMLNVHHVLYEYEVPDHKPRLKGWYDRFSQRPSAKYP